MSKKNLVLSYYLPQFHEIPENNEWWGNGFTEWVCLENWRPYYSGHEIRRPSAVTGNYKIDSVDQIEKQATYASKVGVDGFIFWDYWFGAGRQLLEKPAQLLLEARSTVSFCFAWANHTWYNKSKGVKLIEQKYLGAQDYQRYFDRCLPYFQLDGYIKYEGRPIFFVFDPAAIPDLPVFVEVFRSAARRNGFQDLELIAENTSIDDPHAALFNRVMNSNSVMARRKASHPFVYLQEQLLKRLGWNFLGPLKYEYQCLIERSSQTKLLSEREVPVVISGWDTTPRHGRRGTVFRGFDPEKFRISIMNAISSVRAARTEGGMVVIKSWNEWAEGNVLEEDNLFGSAIADAVCLARQASSW